MTSTTPSSATASSDTFGTDDNDTYNFSIRETTIRDWAIGIGITLGVLLICALIAIQVMRTKIKRLKKERDVYAGKLNGVLVHGGLKYEAVSPSVVESGGLIIPRAELESENEVFESGGRDVTTTTSRLEGRAGTAHGKGLKESSHRGSMNRSFWTRNVGARS